MLTRLMTALVLGTGTIALIALGPAWGIALFLMIAVGICFWEFHAMALPTYRVDRAIGTLCLVTMLAASVWGTALSLAGTVALMIWVPAFFVLFRTEPVADAGRRLMVVWGGAVYVGGCAILGLPLVEHSGWLFTMCIVIWLGDSAAYFTGRAFGRHKLHALVSPNKTIEGALGGLTASILGAAAAHQWLVPEVALGHCLAAGALGGVIGQGGDLVESAFKRSFGVKDSGKILPGHGGALDRLDAILVVMPFFAIYGHWLGLLGAE